MSENLDLVRSIWAAWERGDFSSAEWAHPEIECVATGGLEQKRSIGLPGMRNLWRDFLSQWEGYRAVPDKYRRLDDERVLVLVRHGGRGKASGLPISQAGAATLFHVRGGKVARLVIYGTRERALADLGLKE
jgi:ketosteroid isomerase-like protein